MSSVSRAGSWVATLVAAHLLQQTGGMQVDVQVSVPEVGWVHGIIVVLVAVCAFLCGMLACRGRGSGDRAPSGTGGDGSGRATEGSSVPDDIAIGRVMGDDSSRASDAGESTAWDVLSDTRREQPGEDAADPPPPGLVRVPFGVRQAPAEWVAERQGVPPDHGDGPRRRRLAPRIAEAQRQGATPTELSEAQVWVRDRCEKHRRDDLRQELGRRGLSTTGLKADLAVRLARDSMVTIGVINVMASRRRAAKRRGMRRTKVPLANLADDEGLEAARI